MSREMRQACEVIFSGHRFRDAVTAVVTRELGAALAPIAAPALTKALEKELPDVFMRGLIDLFAGQDLGRIPKNGGHVERRERDEAIIAALVAGSTVREVAHTFDRSERQVWRLKRRITDNFMQDVRVRDSEKSGSFQREMIKK